MKRILWLAPYPYKMVRGEYGGESHPAPWITELAKEISKENQLTIASSSNKVSGVETFRAGEIDFIFVQSPRFRYDLISLFKIRINKLTDYLKKIRSKFDLIHVHGTEHQYENVAERLNIPYIISIQGLINMCRPYYPDKLNRAYVTWVLSSLYERSGIKKGKYFFCRTKFDTKYVKRINPGAKIFVNWELIREEFFRDLFDVRSKSLLFVGGTNPFKGIREALHCLCVLKKRGLGIKLRICGSGKKEKVERLLKRENLEILAEDIDFLGYQSVQQLANVFQTSFCLIHPSYMDNSPNSICEAQVAGLPVVASEVGGVGSLIADETTGLLVNRYDHVGIADRICRLIHDKNFYRTISENSRFVARKRHNIEKIVANTLSTYSELMVK